MIPLIYPPRNSDVATLWSVLLGTRMLPPSDLSYSELGCHHPLICLTRNSDVATLWAVFLSFFLLYSELGCRHLRTWMLPPSDLSYSELGCRHPLICLTRNSDVATLWSFFLSFFLLYSELGCRHLGTRMLPPSDLSYSDVATLWSVLLGCSRLGTRMSPPQGSELGTRNSGAPEAFCSAPNIFAMNCVN